MWAAVGKAWRHVFVVSLLPIWLLGCSGGVKKVHEGVSAPSKSEVEEIMRPFVEGDFEKYALRVYSFRHLPKQRLKEQLTLLRQHAAERDSTTGGVAGYSVRRVAYNEGDTIATAYVEVIYAQGDTVDILMPLVWQNGEWWRR